MGKFFKMFFWVCFLWMFLPVFLPCYFANFFLVIFKFLYYLCYRFIGIFFYISNRLQRYLAKPWLIFIKRNWKSESAKQYWKRLFGSAKIPLYILLTPVRLVNALYYNVFGHLFFQLCDLLQDFWAPDCVNHFWDAFKMESFKALFKYLFGFPIRFVVDLCWHLPVTLIECVLWTVIDTFVPALTLYHGTLLEFGNNIVSSPKRAVASNDLTGKWNVGAGNFAGDGIYFAPAWSTAKYYAKATNSSTSGQVCILHCRVSLGKVMDLGLAPYDVYSECGYANAHGVSRYGITHGYTSGEWWRSDRKWWECTLYQKSNAYKHTWRIRPLYVESFGNLSFFYHRVYGGMYHWF